MDSGCNLDGNESHCVFSATDPFRKNATSIVAIGMGLRGVIYAGYTFSEKILGVGESPRLVTSSNFENSFLLQILGTFGLITIQCSSLMELK